MATSDVSIANRALTKLGSARILSLSDNSEPARVINSLYEAVRDAEVQRHRWKFAIRRTSLPALVDAPAFGYSYQYELPADHLALIQVGEWYVPAVNKQVARWSVESGRILTDAPAPLPIRYIARVTDPALFDPLFAEALAARIALEACESITQSQTKYERMAADYRATILEAARMSSLLNPPDALPDGGWLWSREGYLPLSNERFPNEPYPAGFVVGS